VHQQHVQIGDHTWYVVVLKVLQAVEVITVTADTYT
jgi:hypothetical protein